MKFLFLSACFLLLEATYAANAQFGQNCNAEVNCNEGLVCWNPSEGSDADAAVCVNSADIGGICGGTVRFPSQCKAPYKCKMPEDTKLMGARGRCVEEVDDVCDNNHVCKKGVKCIKESEDAEQGRCESTKARYGEKCGGGFFGAKQCVEGLTCEKVRNAPGVSGTCQRRTKLGESCEGGVTFAPPCEEGLYCSKGISVHPRIPGICRKSVGLGEVCGGMRPIKCVEPLICHTFIEVVGAEGKCKKVRSGLDEPCGGEFEIECANSLECKAYPDGSFCAAK